MISAIVLAAGESKRMGKVKQLLPFAQSTVLEQVINNLLESKLDEIIVVLGYQAQKIARKIGSNHVKIVINPNFKQGMSSSIKCGLSQIDKRAEAIMIMLGDQPLIGKEIVDTLIEMFLKSNQGIIVPVYEGRRGHPIIFDVKYKSELLSLKGDIGGRKVIETHLQDILEVEVNSPGVIIDIDNKADYLSRTCRFS